MRGKKIVDKLIGILRKLRFKNIPILLKIFICFGLIIFSMVFLSYAQFNNYKKDKEVSTLNIIHQSNIQAVEKIDEYIMDMNTITKFPLIRQYKGYDNFTQELEKFSRTDKIDLNFQAMIDNLFTDIQRYKAQIHSVVLFNLNGKSDYYMLEGIDPPYNPKNQKWFKETIENFGLPCVVGTFMLPNVLDQNKNPVYIFSVARGIVRVHSGKVVGVIQVNTNVEFLQNLIQKMLVTSGQRVLIIDKNGKVVSDTVKDNITKKAQADILEAINTSSDKTKSIEMNGTKYLISYRTSSITGWKIVNMIPEVELNREIYEMRHTTTVLTITTILIAFGLALFLSNKIVKPLKKLIVLMKLVENGDFGVKIESNSDDEIGTLTKAFNNMCNKIKKLIDEVYINKINQKDLELQMLQNQINPHFLYNALDSIHMMSEINNDAESSKMSTALGKILRYGIDTKRTIVPVWEEIDKLEDYIMLQQIRFEDLYNITISIDKEILDAIMIKLILQPIVENAIQHGLSEQADGGEINIVGYRSENNMIFEVVDNGIGMQQNQVEVLNEYINSRNNLFSSIGLRNVNTRIKLHYGNEYGLVITSNLGEGTKVSVKLPFEMNKMVPFKHLK